MISPGSIKIVESVVPPVIPSVVVGGGGLAPEIVESIGIRAATQVAERFAQIGNTSSSRLTLWRPGGFGHPLISNRPATLADLGDITPDRVDKYDTENYRPEGHLLASKRNDRFVLADIEKLTSRSIVAMLALGKSLVMRRMIGGKPTSIYIVGDHTWAIWGWSEAIARGEIMAQGLRLIHIDDHNDLAGDSEEPFKRKITIDNVDDVIENRVKRPGDPTGIGSFIVPALDSQMLGSMYWEYGVNPTVETSGHYKRRKAEWDKRFSVPDPWGLRDDPAYREWSLSNIAMHNSGRYYDFGDPFRARLPGVRGGYRADAFPFQQVYGGSSQRERILDYDIDVADDHKVAAELLAPHLRAGGAGAITIAISPQYGARKNHIQKMTGILMLLRT